MPQGLSKYDCTVVAHDADSNIQGGCVAPRRNASLLLAGDSIMSQLAWAATCAALPGVQVSSFQLIAVPPADALYGWLRMALNTFDVLVLNVGLWYNWSPSILANVSIARMVDETSADWTEVQMLGCPATRFYVDGTVAPEDTFRSKWSQLSSGSHRWPGKWSSPSTLPYAQARERCRNFRAFGHQAYVSDLKRLAAALHRLESESSPIGHRVAWMSTAAQHYHGTLGSVFDPAVLDRRRWPFAAGRAYCAPIKSSQMWAARGRNDLAEAALRDSQLHFVNAWDSDVRYHDQHARVANDCSHACLNSNLMHGKLHALGSKLCKILQPRRKQRANASPMVESCLRHGAWAASGHRPNLKWMLRPDGVRDSQSCTASGAATHGQRWKGAHAGCARLLSSPIDGAFNGAFSGQAGRISAAVLGDSLARQIWLTLRSVQRKNPHLQNLSLVAGGRMAMIPRSVQGCLQILDSLPFPKATRRVLLIGPSAWYNIFASHCNPSRCPIPVEHQVEAARALNETHPSRTVSRYHNRKDKDWIHYDYARKSAGLDTINEFQQDIAILLETVLIWKARHQATVVWYEAPDQHFPRPGGNDSEAERRCGPVPGTWLPAQTHSTVLPLLASNLCFDGRGIHNVTPKDCPDAGSLHNWRNIISHKLLQQRAPNLPIVPLSAALHSMGHQHYSWFCPGGYCQLDCTHWCEASDAGMHVAEASLNTIAAALQPMTHRRQ